MATIVLNGWMASAAAWSLCRALDFAGGGARLFSDLEQLDGEPERHHDALAEPATIVGWSMGGSSALRLAVRRPDRVARLVLVAATPRMMEDKTTLWKGMSARRLDAFRRCAEIAQGNGLFGPPPGKPNPYRADTPGNLARGLDYLERTDLRADLMRVFAGGASFPVHIFHSVRDGIVHPDNADWLHHLFPQVAFTRVEGAEHALPIFIPELIDRALGA